MLSARDPLPAPPRRVLVAGTSGVGKTTLARRIADATGIRHTEIDALFHGPAWTPRESFEAEVDAFTSEDSWVTEWQYRAVRRRLAERADTVVWLDLPAHVSFTRVVRRTLRRGRTREVLWNGNVEPPLWTILIDRDHIIRWAIRTRRKYRRTVPQLEWDHPHLTVVRLGSQREVEEWLAALATP